MSTSQIPRLNYGVKLTRNRIYFFVVRKDALKGRLDKLVEERLAWLENEFAEMKPINWLGPHSERKANRSKGTLLAGTWSCGGRQPSSQVES